MPISDAELTEGWEHVLKLSRLERGQVVTFLTSQHTHPQTLRTGLQAASRLGAIVCRLDLPPVNGAKSLSRDALAYLGTTPLSGNKAAIATLKNSDLVLDLMTLLFSPEQLEILSGGTKILMVTEPPEILMRLLPSKEDRQAVLAAADHLAAAKTMRVVSKAGTDATFQLGDFGLVKEYGFVDEPGRWDHWPGGFLATFPNEGSANGTIVIDRGDILLPQKTYLSTPITLTIVDGFVTTIDGELDAELLRDYIESFQDPDAYAISHIGWGLQKRARWSTLSLYDKEATVGMDARSYAGNFLFSMGPNNDGGGNRVTACHLDIPLRGCDVLLDGVPMVKAGVLTET